MPLHYLQGLRDTPLPVTVTDPEGVRRIEMLLAAQLLVARLERAGVYSMPHAATVLEITADGFALLQRLDAKARTSAPNG
ncbi:hypothetical protein J2W30_004421 [Variovorax boronicumulans]|nr:hypothetical protein [Variovorax boronicumulans]MDQ0036646.1 hypothetical protein [Variovorax boronicumulans]